MEENPNPHSRPHGSPSPLIWVVGAVVLVAVSFFGAVQYLKSNNNSSTNNSQYGADTDSDNSMPMSGGGTDGNSGGSASSCSNGQPTLMLDVGGQQVQACGQPTVGQVTAASASSVTVKPNSGGGAQTFSITSNTEISDGGNAVTPSDIKIGDTLAIIVGSSSTSQAEYILVNPNLSNAQ